LGCDRTRLLALDLVAGDLQAARRRMPWLLAGVGDASRLPLPDGRADLVFQSTMLSSILDPGRRRRICAEAARVLKPGGAFVSYDTRYPNPWNPHTRPVGLRELRKAFPGWRVAARSVTLLPPLLRALLPLSPALCRAAERIPFLRSHRLAWAIKP
jgi:SAM-dependent methyltransferase